MPKKTVKLNEPIRAAGPFTEGVSITYKGQEIARGTETVEYALLTANSIVERNIGVAYKKPEPSPVTIPVYMQVGDADPVYRNDITAIPGSPIEETYNKPAGAGVLKAIEWNNGDEAFFKGLPSGFDLVIYGYMPKPDTEQHYIIIQLASL